MRRTASSRSDRLQQQNTGVDKSQDEDEEGVDKSQDMPA